MKFWSEHCYNVNREYGKQLKEDVLKNGYGAMVVLSLEKYASLTDSIDVEAAILERLNNPVAFESDHSTSPDVWRKGYGQTFVTK